MKNIHGFTLIETLIAIALMAIITSGLIFFLQTKMGHEAVIQERSDIYKEADQIINMIRVDLSTAKAVTDMEYFNSANGDAFFTGENAQIPMDDPSTLQLREDANPPLDDFTTSLDESLLNYENLPYGITYDYVFGITNSGDMDTIYFRGSVADGNKRIPANICYRLVKKRLRALNGIPLIEEDTGADRKPDEEEPGFHPVANPDPKRDNFDPIFNGTATESNGLLDRGEPDQNGDLLIDNAHIFEFQRIVTTIIEEDAGNKKPITRLNTLSNSVVAFNILYYDRQKRQYVEPLTTIKRFSYPSDVGVVGRFGTETPNQLFSFGSMTTEYFVNGSSPLVSQGDYIFLRGSGTPFNVYQINNIQILDKKIDFLLPPGQGTATPIQFIPAGIFDASGALYCPAVKDGFANLRPGDRIFAQQGAMAPFAVNPDIYTIIDKRGGGLVMDLRDQSPLLGTSTVFFRAAYLPSAVKINLTWRLDQSSINRGEPFYMTLGNTIALEE